jgi:flagellar biosynthesis protein FliR
MPAALQFTSAEISSWVGAFLWPFFRIGALLAAAPLFSTQTVPVRARLIIAIALTFVIVPLLPRAPQVDPFSVPGVWILAQQILIGLCLGFALRLAFTALELAGEIAGQLMGLGFASLLDPNNGVPVPMVSTFYMLIATLLFLAFNGHLVLITLLVDSFKSIPLTEGIGSETFRDLVSIGSDMFAGAVLISLPMIASLLLVNLAFGVMTRAAPQLNIIAVGFPVTLIIGFIVMLLTLPLLPTQWSNLLDVVFGSMRSLMRIS